MPSRRACAEDLGVLLSVGYEDRWSTQLAAASVGGSVGDLWFFMASRSSEIRNPDENGDESERKDCDQARGRHVRPITESYFSEGETADDQCGLEHNCIEAECRR